MVGILFTRDGLCVLSGFFYYSYSAEKLGSNDESVYIKLAKSVFFYFIYVIKPMYSF